MTLPLCTLGAWSVATIGPSLVAFSRSNRVLGTRFPHVLSSKMMAEDFKRLHLLRKFRIIFLVHGFLDDHHNPWMCEMKDALLNVDDQVVVMVNWKGQLDVGWWQYSKAAASTQTIGTWLGEHVKAMKSEQPGVSVWGIGHGLGAHLLGKAGRVSGMFDRISGLDPAGPSWEEFNQEKRLQRTDANMVDVIHTDGYPAWSKSTFR